MVTRSEIQKRKKRLLAFIMALAIFMTNGAVAYAAEYSLEFDNSVGTLKSGGNVVDTGITFGELGKDKVVVLATGDTLKVKKEDCESSTSAPSVSYKINGEYENASTYTVTGHSFDPHGDYYILTVGESNDTTIWKVDEIAQSGGNISGFCLTPAQQIEYECDSSIATMPEALPTTCGAAGAAVNIPSVTNISDSRYTFSGWYKKNTETQVTQIDGNTQTPLVLVARFNKAKVDYSFDDGNMKAGDDDYDNGIELDTDLGNDKVCTFSYEDTFSLMVEQCVVSPSVIYLKADGDQYDDEDIDGDSIEYANGDTEYKVTIGRAKAAKVDVWKLKSIDTEGGKIKNIILVPAHQIEYECNPAKGNLPEGLPDERDPDSDVQLDPATPKNGYTFNGWYIKNTNIMVDTITSTTATPIILVARFDAIEEEAAPAPAPRRPSYSSESSTTKETLASVERPTLTGTFQIGTDVKSKLPKDTTITLSDGSTRSVSIDWTNMSKDDSEERYRGTIKLPYDVENPNGVVTTFEYVATLTGVKLVSIDAPEDHRVFAFGEERIIPEKRPQTAVIHLADGTTCDANIKWDQSSKYKDEIKYLGSVQMPVGVVNLDNISTRVTFTATFIEKPTGHFEIDTLSTKYSYGYDLVELLDRSEGKVTYTSDDESVVTVSASRTYNLQTGQVEDEGKYVYINKVAAGKTTVRAFINGYEVDSLDVTITRAEQKISVTSNKRTTYTISAETLKKSGQSIKLNISGNKTDLRYKSSKSSIIYRTSSKTLRLPKGLKKGTYTFTVTAKKSKQYEKAEAKFTIKVK